MYHAYKMNKKTSLLEGYVIFVDLTEKQNKYSKIFIHVFVVFFSFVLFKYLNE